MRDKITALETVIELMIDAAADTEDLRMIIDVLYDKADKLDRKIIEIEEEF